MDSSFIIINTHMNECSAQTEARSRVCVCVCVCSFSSYGHRVSGCPASVLQGAPLLRVHAPEVSRVCRSSESLQFGGSVSHSRQHVRALMQIYTHMHVTIT